ncbi:MAG: DUF29 domain-containing protein [Thioploca sp.]|nr:DUF29 domain-containing protein [Thioploca sp.]
MKNLTLEYDRDFDAWIQQHITLLKQGRVNEIDIEHLIEELEDMGKSNRRELVNRLIPLIAHLLKWEYQYNQLQDRWGSFTGGSWKGTITEQRTKITLLFKQNPSLKSKLQDAVLEAYPNALDIAVDETGLPKSTFPKSCSYTIEQLLDRKFYPTLKD